MTSLSDKVLLVTGAGSAAGIGFATARIAAKRGARVILTDIATEAVKRRGAELAALGHDVLALGHDVTDQRSWRDVAEAADRFGGIDILVNNAGITVLGAIETLTLDDWRRVFHVNVDSQFLGCQIASEQMRRRGGGSIINVSSIAGLVGAARSSPYCSSKGAVTLLTKSLALELAADNIRVNSVHPGVIMTDMQRDAIAADPKMVPALLAMVPLGKMGEPDDIAKMIAFLASEDAKYVTGAEFVVDGGLIAQ